MIRWLLLAAFLLLIIRLWPRTLAFILVASTVVGTGVFFWTRHLEDERAQIAISVRYDGAGCPAAKPLLVTFLNSSPAPLERVTFSIHAKVPGYSRVVTPYTYKQYESDKVLAPGEAFSACYAKPLMDRDRSNSEVGDAADLEWSASVDNVYFQ